MLFQSVVWSLLLGLSACAQGAAQTDVVDEPDGAPGDPADARDVTDANPGTPDAQGCTDQLVNLLVNPNLDDAPAGTGWVQDPFDLAIIQAPPAGVGAHSGTLVAWLGGYAELSDDHAYQDVAVPASATSLAVAGVIRIETEDSTAAAFDNASLQLRTTGGAVIADIGAWSNTSVTGSYLPFSVALPTAHAGETLRLQLDASTDSSLATSFYVDTFTVNAMACVP